MEFPRPSELRSPRSGFELLSGHEAQESLVTTWLQIRGNRNCQFPKPGGAVAPGEDGLQLLVEAARANASELCSS